MPLYVTPDERDLVEVYRGLPAPAKEELLAKAHEYQRITSDPKPTRANPYPLRKK